MAVSLLFCITSVWQQACSFVLRPCGGEKEKEKKEKEWFCCLCGCKLKACCFAEYYACRAASLYFVLCLCGGKLVVLYNACVAAKKKKKRRRRFVGCVAVSFKACCFFVLRLWGGKLVVCITPVGRQARSFV